MKNILAIVIIILLIGIGLLFLTNNNKDDSDTEEIDDNTLEINSEVSIERITEFRSGSYSQFITYDSPGGPDDMTVNIELDGSIIKAVSIVEAPGNPTSGRYQTQFANAIADEVVGEDIEEVSPSRVAGASLTTDAFNKALVDIRLQAAI